MTEAELKKAMAYANDPASDRTFMAMKMLELLMKISGDKYFTDELLINLVGKSYLMADEFVRLSPELESGKL